MLLFIYALKQVETSIGIFRMNDAGIMEVLSNDSPVTCDGIVESIAAIRQMVGDKKVCMAGDITYSRSMNKATSQCAAKEFPKVCKAFAMYSASVFGSMAANVFFHFYPMDFPVKTFTDRIKAMDWLRQFQ